MKYLVLLISFFIVEIFYVKLALYFKIYDIPNNRSLHSTQTPRGGGIIINISIFTWFFHFHYYPIFIVGLLLLSCVSLIDDIYTVSNKIRFLVHLLSVMLIMTEYIDKTSVLSLIFIIILGVAILNSFNFMDGINGLTGLYSLVVSITLIIINLKESYVEMSLLYYLLIGILVFLFFNFRNKAIVFSGDVGSIGIGFIIVFMLYRLMNLNNDYKFIFLLFLYGLDTTYTIMYRLQKKENIFQPHKKHFFQLLVNEKQKTHLEVAILYCVTQVVLNIWIYYGDLNEVYFYIPFLILILLIHFERKKMNYALNFN